MLGALRGRVVDLETAAPVEGALVVEWYVGGGASYVVLDYDVDITILDQQRTTDIDPEWGYYVQLGVDFDMNDSSHVFLQGVYRFFEAEIEEDDLGLESDFGIDMVGGSLNLGVAFTW